MLRCPICEVRSDDSAESCFICGYNIREYFLRIKQEEERKRQEEEARQAAVNKARAAARAEQRKNQAVFSDESTDGRISYSYSAEKNKRTERIFAESDLDEEIGKHDEETGGFMKHLKGIFSRRK